MIQKKDAESIASAKKAAYLNEQILNLMTEAFEKIRNEANEMNFRTVLHLDRKKMRFTDEISEQVKKRLLDFGYQVKIESFTKDILRIDINWSQEEEK